MSPAAIAPVPVSAATAWTASGTTAPAATVAQAASAQTQQPGSTAGGPVVLASAPAAPVPVYEPWRDRSDVVTSADGAQAHSLTPVDRAQRAAYKPRDMVWHPERECLPVLSVKASSSVRGCAAAATTDRSLATRWTPSGSGMQSITYDLGQVQEVGAVSVVSYASKASQTAFTVEASRDGKTFTQVDAGVLIGRGTNTALRTFVPAEARYMRITLNASDNVRTGLYEVGFHAAPAEQRAEAR
jgi:hypothetical protein